jgi:hypothetical protein
LELESRPSAAELDGLAKDGVTLRQLAKRYGRSTKQIKRWFKYHGLEWCREKRTEDIWVDLLAGRRFEDAETTGRRANERA